MKIINKTKKSIIAEHTEMADTAVSRMVGLLGRTSLPDGNALIITQCRSIHMLFMKFPIDAVFVDKHNRVAGLVKNIKPFFMSPYFIKAKYVIELPAGVIDKTHTEKKDEILVEK